MAEKLKRFGIKFTLSQILQHFQQDLKNWVSRRKITGSRLHELQASQFLDLVQDVRYSTLVEDILFFGKT